MVKMLHTAQAGLVINVGSSNSAHGLSLGQEDAAQSPESPAVLQSLHHHHHHSVSDERLERLNARLAKLDKGALPEFQRGLAALDAEFRERQLAATDWFHLRCHLINREHVAEKMSAKRELEAKRQELMDLLLNELADKRRAVDQERHSFDLNFDGDVHDLKQPATWRLRNRHQLKAAAIASTPLGSDEVGSSAVSSLSLPVVVSGPSVVALSVVAASVTAASVTAAVDVSAVSSVVGPGGGVVAGATPTAAAAALGLGLPLAATPWCGFDPLLADADILEDLRAVAKAKQRVVVAAPAASAGGVGSSQLLGSQQQQHSLAGASPAARLQVIDGVLFYRDRSFGRGAPVSLETRRAARYCGVVVSVNQQEVIIKRSSDGGKMKVSLKHLRSGKFLLKRKT